MKRFTIALALCLGLLASTFAPALAAESSAVSHAAAVAVSIAHPGRRHVHQVAWRYDPGLYVESTATHSGGTGTYTVFRLGSVVFCGNSTSGAYSQDNDNFYFSPTANAQYLKLGAGTGGGALRLLEGSGGGTNYTGFSAPATLAANVQYTLPSADGTAGQILQTDGSKTLSWATGTSGITIADTAVAYATGANAIGGDATNFVFSHGTNAQHLALGAGTGPGALWMLEGSGTGTNKAIVTVATNIASDVTVTIPTAASDTLVGKATTDTLTNKTLTAPVIGGAGTLRTSSPTIPLGYDLGAGGQVTQGTSKSTAVTLNTVTGVITMNNASLANATAATFTVNNTTVAAGDIVVVNHASGGTAGGYLVSVSAIALNSFKVTVYNCSGGALVEAPAIDYAVIKGSAS